MFEPLELPLGALRFAEGYAVVSSLADLALHLETLSLLARLEHLLLLQRFPGLAVDVGRPLLAVVQPVAMYIGLGQVGLTRGDSSTHCHNLQL